MTDVLLTPEHLRKLALPFPLPKHSVKIQAYNKEKTKAMAIVYLDARDVMDRLDQVVGPYWSDSYKTAAGKAGVECTLTVMGVSRTDVGDDDNDNEPTKSGYSDAFKRAAVKFGIGRYLYDLPRAWIDLEHAGDKFLSDKQKDEVLRRVSAMLNNLAKSSQLQPQPEAQAHPPLQVEAAQAQPSLPSQAEAEAQLKQQVPGYKTEAEKKAAKVQAKTPSGLPPMDEPPQPDDEQPEGMPQADSEPAIYTKGVLRYRKNVQGQEEVELKPGTWKLAQGVIGPKGLTPEAMQKFNKMFGQDAGSTKHMIAHLEKWFKVKAIPSLTWEQLAACVKANAAEPLYDPRWYQAKIDELAAKQVKTETKSKVADAKALLGDQAAAVAKAYCLPANDPLLAELARLTVPNDAGGRDPAPLALAYLYAKPKKGETRKPWTKDSREHLETLLTLVLEQGLEIGSEEFEICIESIELGGVAE